MAAGCAVLTMVGAAQTASSSQQPVQVSSAPAVPGPQIESDFDLTVGGVFVDVGGSSQKFRTERNVRSGFNIGSLNLNLRPIKGTKTFFDFLTLSAAGVGDSSPYQRGDLRAAKRRLYDLKVGYRKYNYFFGLPEFAMGWHPEDSVGRSSNVSLKLLPDRTVSFLAGYRRHQLYGTRFTSQALLLDTYPVSYPRRLSSDEYRGGVQLKTRRISLLFDQSFLRYKDDQQLLPNGDASVGLRGNLLAGGARNVPSRMTTPVTRVLGRYQPNRRYEVTGRYIYSGADLKIGRYENLLNRVGLGRFPVRQIISSSGISEKPTHNAAFAQSLDITERLTFHQRFLYDTYTLTGFLDTTGVLSLINEARNQQIDLPFSETGGTITEYKYARNEAELDYELTPSVSLVGGHAYSDRHLGFGDRGISPRTVVTITNAGIGGLVWRPGAKGRIRAEVEKGTASEAFNRIDPLSYLRWKLRGQYRPTARLTVSGSAVIDDNSNNTEAVRYDLDNRQLGVQAVYVASSRLLLSGGYNYLRIRTSTDIVFYALSELTGGLSLYETNTHLAHLQAQFPIGKRLDVHAGYEYIKDTGATFPLRMHVPRVGFSLRLHPNVSLEADWRYYSYDERRFSIRDYRANVVAVGLKFTR